VSSNGNICCTRFAHYVLGCRTVVGIHGKVVKKNGRNLFSRLIHARNDKVIIVAWKLDIMRVFQVSNVRSTSSVRLSLTASFQTELALSTHTIVSDMHQNILKGSEGANDRNLSVSNVSSSAHHRISSDNQLGSDLISDLEFNETAILRLCVGYLGESPPSPPRACFGRDELIEEIVGLAENLTRRSHWCWRDRQDVHHSDRPPPRSH